MLTTRGLDARGIDLQASNAVVNLDGAVVTNGGQLASGSGDGAIGVIIGDSNFSTTGGALTIGPTGSITTFGGGAFGVLASGSGSGARVDIANGATVTANGGAGEADGFPSGGVAINALNGQVNNAGVVSANPATVSVALLLGGKGGTFTNEASGVVNGGLAAVAFFGAPGTTFTLDNRNTISGAIFDDESGDQVVTNSGTLDVAFNGGGMDLGDGDDRLDNSGSLIGAVNLGDGSDEVSVTAGADLTGLVGMDGGDDTGTGGLCGLRRQKRWRCCPAHRVACSIRA